jgi:hypothetical protein
MLATCGSMGNRTRRRDRRGPRLAVRLLVGGLFLVVAGCGARPPAVHPAGGRITFRGKPAAGFMVEFSSDAEATKGISASGQTGPDGAFSLATRFDGRSLPGAVAGPHRVVVVPPPAASDDTGEILPVPIRYADYLQSGLTAVVDATGPNEFAFDLKP